MEPRTKTDPPALDEPELRQLQERSRSTAAEAREQQELREHMANMTQHLRKSVVRSTGASRAESPPASAKVVTSARAELNASRAALQTARENVQSKDAALAAHETALEAAKEERSRAVERCAASEAGRAARRAAARLKGRPEPAAAANDTSGAEVQQLDGEIAVLDQLLTEARQASSSASNAVAAAERALFEAARRLAYAELLELVEGDLQQLVMRALAFEQGHSGEAPFANRLTLSSQYDSESSGSFNLLRVPFPQTFRVSFAAARPLWEGLRRELLDPDASVP